MLHYIPFFFISFITRSRNYTDEIAVCCKLWKCLHFTQLISFFISSSIALKWRKCNPSSLGLNREDPNGTAILDTAWVTSFLPLITGFDLLLPTFFSSSFFPKVNTTDTTFFTKKIGISWYVSHAKWLLEKTLFLRWFANQCVILCAKDYISNYNT